MKVFRVFLLLSVTLPIFIWCGCNCNQQKEKNEIVKTEDTLLLRTPETQRLDSLIELQPGNANLYYELGEVRMLQNELEAAISNLQKAISIETKPDFYLALSKTYFLAGDLVMSTKVLEEGIEINPSSQILLVALSKNKLYFKEHAQSIQYADSALKQNIYNAEAYFLKGMTLKETGDTNKAIQQFQTCIEQDPAYFDAYMQLGILYSRRGNALAVPYLENALNTNPESIEALYALGYHYQTVSKDYSKAKETYRTIIEKNPDYAQAFYNMGYIHFQTDSLEKAEKNFKIAVKVDPVYADAYYMLGLCAEVRNDFSTARKQYAQTLSIDGNHTLATVGLNRIKKK